jgi:spore maturation protein CgeB
MESMAMKRPLLTDGTDKQGGMDKLFVDGYHYIGYESYLYSNLEEKCKWVLDNPKESQQIAEQGYQEVCRNHTIDSRMNLLMEVTK